MTAIGGPPRDPDPNARDRPRPAGSGPIAAVRIPGPAPSDRAQRRDPTTDTGVAPGWVVRARAVLARAARDRAVSAPAARDRAVSAPAARDRADSAPAARDRDQTGVPAQPMGARRPALGESRLSARGGPIARRSIDGRARHLDSAARPATGTNKGVRASGRPVGRFRRLQSPLPTSSARTRSW